MKSRRPGSHTVLLERHLCGTEITKQLRGELYLEELSVMLHEEEYQSFTLRSRHFTILNKRSLKSAADQGLVISLKEKETHRRESIRGNYIM